MTTIRIGARRSPLAVAQAEWVGAALVAQGFQIEMIGLDSLGDIDRRALTEIGGTGVFATAVRDALRAGQIDVAVHSLKDLPVAQPEGLIIAATPTREDANDILVGATPEQWTNQTIIGTGSPRRRAQLLQLAEKHGVQPQFVSIRGNVDRRLEQVANGTVHVTVLAKAGLLRLGREDALIAGHWNGVPLTELSFDDMLPAPGQGSLGVECCSDAAPEMIAVLATIDDAATRAAVTAERAFLQAMEAGCLAPVAALATPIAGGEPALQLEVFVEGEPSVRLNQKGAFDQAHVLGRELAERALAAQSEARTVND